MPNHPQERTEHKKVRVFDGYTDRLPISPTNRNPSLNDSRFEPINKTPINLSKYRKTVDVSIGKQSPRVNTQEMGTSKFYDSQKESVMSRLNTGVP